MALIMVLTERGDMVLSLQVGDLNLNIDSSDDAERLDQLDDDTTRMISAAVREALNDEDADFDGEVRLHIHNDDGEEREHSHPTALTFEDGGYTVAEHHHPRTLNAPATHEILGLLLSCYGLLGGEAHPDWESEAVRDFERVEEILYRTGMLRGAGYDLSHAQRTARGGPGV